MCSTAAPVSIDPRAGELWPSRHRQWRKRRKRSQPALSEDEFRAIEDALDETRTAREGEIHSRTS
jgi:hypothetical protein